MSTKQVVKLSKNKTIHDTKAAAITAASALSLQDGETRLVRYKNSEDKIDTLVVVGTPDGNSIINDTTRLENEIANIKDSSENLGVLVWEEN